MTITTITMQCAYAAQSLHHLPLNQGNGVGDLWLDFAEDDQRDWLTRFTEPHRTPARSTLSLNRDFADFSLHWGVADSAEQDAQTLGLQYQGFYLTGFRGAGDTVSSVIHPFNRVGNFQFHGGLRQQYEFAGGRVGYDINAKNRLHLSHARINAPGFNDRTVYALGLDGKKFSLSLTRVEEASRYAGRAISASADFGRYQATLQHLKANNDASYSSLRFDTTTSNGNTFELAMEQRHNPFFDDGNENRIVFGFRRSIGPDPFARRNFVGSVGGGATLAGLGSVGAALALSSGGGEEGDDRSRFRTPDAAAIDILNTVNPASIAEKREYGGYVFRYADGSYANSQPVQGDHDSITLQSPTRIAPPGAVASASYHTHGSFDPRYEKERFSRQDVAASRSLGIDGYLGTPAGRFMFYDLSANSVSATAPGFLATSY